METHIIRLVILHSDWSSGRMDLSVALHWSFLHSLSLRVTDLCWRLTSALRVGSLVPDTLSPAGSSGVFHSECQPVSEAVGRHAGDVWE